MTSSIPPPKSPSVPPDPVGGMVPSSSDDLLALGDADDYSDELEFGEDDDSEEYDSDEYEPQGGAALSLSFGAQTTQLAVDRGGDLETGAWDLGDLDYLQDLVVQEVKGEFGGDGGESRMDAFVMEEEFDPDAQMITAVWEGPRGEHVLGTQVHSSQEEDLRPYWILGAILSAAGVLVMLGIGLVIVLSLMMGPTHEIVPLTDDNRPKVELERKPLDENLTADEILEEVLKKK